MLVRKHYLTNLGKMGWQWGKTMSHRHFLLNTKIRFSDSSLIIREELKIWKQKWIFRSSWMKMDFQNTEIVVEITNDQVNWFDYIMNICASKTIFNRLHKKLSLEILMKNIMSYIILHKLIKMTLWIKRI